MVRLFLFCVCIFSFSVSLFADQWSLPTVSHAFGQCYLQLKRDPIPKPLPIETNQTVSYYPPYAFVTSPDSFLEVRKTAGDLINCLRLGRSSAIEIGMNGSYFMISGSALFSQDKPKNWIIKSENSAFHFFGQGTWLMEVTPLGFKVILLEGELLPTSNAASTREPILPGELALITGKEGLISQSLKVELPVLLSTSRLINLFPNELPSQSKLISAARVQSFRTKTRYNAFIGGVSEDSQLRIWSPNSKKENED
jgi:hypothetical protein